VGVFWFHKRISRTEFDSCDLAGGRIETTDAEYQTLGDRFADLVVYHHGFGGQWQRFVISLTRAWFDSYDRTRISPKIYDDEFTALLVRLVFTLDVSNRWDDVLSVGKGRFTETEVYTLIHLTYEHLRSAFPQDAPDVHVRLEGAVKSVLSESLRFGDALAREYRKWVSQEVADPSVRRRYANIIRREAGTIIPLDPDDDLNLLFGELYWNLQPGHDGVAAPKPFQRMVTIARSAAIEYHKRQAT